MKELLWGSEYNKPVRLQCWTAPQRNFTFTFLVPVPTRLKCGQRPTEYCPSYRRCDPSCHWLLVARTQMFLRSVVVLSLSRPPIKISRALSRKTHLATCWICRTRAEMRVVCVWSARNCLKWRTIKVSEQIYIKYSKVKFYENPFIRHVASIYKREDVDMPILVGLFL
jgi:hypothetical protein